MTDVPLRTPEQAAQTAARHNAKLAKRFPLLVDSGQLEFGARVWTTEQVLADEQGWRARMAAVEQAALTRGSLLRDRVAEHVSPAQLAEWDAYFRQVLPQDDAAYVADYWFGQLRSVAPGEAARLCLNRGRHASMARWQTHCPACGQALEMA